MVLQPIKVADSFWLYRVTL